MDASQGEQSRHVPYQYCIGRRRAVPPTHQLWKADSSASGWGHRPDTGHRDQPRALPGARPTRGNSKTRCGNRCVDSVDYRSLRGPPTVMITRPRVVLARDRTRSGCGGDGCAPNRSPPGWSAVPTPWPSQPRPIGSGRPATMDQGRLATVSKTAECVRRDGAAVAASAGRVNEGQHRWTSRPSGPQSTRDSSHEGLGERIRRRAPW
jgi:hypothetical protein